MASIPVFPEHCLDENYGMDEWLKNEVIISGLCIEGRVSVRVRDPRGNCWLEKWGPGFWSSLYLWLRHWSLTCTVEWCQAVAKVPSSSWFLCSSYSAWWREGGSECAWAPALSWGTRSPRSLGISWPRAPQEAVLICHTHGWVLAVHHLCSCRAMNDHVPDGLLLPLCLFFCSDPRARYSWCSLFLESTQGPSGLPIFPLPFLL